MKCNVFFIFIIVLLLHFFLPCREHCRKTSNIGVTIGGRSGWYSLPVPICIDNHRPGTNTVICSHIAIQHVSICKS